MRGIKLLVVGFLCTYLAADAQPTQCKIVKQDFYYITFDVRNKSDYPITMSGVSKSFNLEDLLLKNKKSFISSFYRKSFYTPDLFTGYKKMLLACMGDSLGYIYLKKYPVASSSVISQLAKHSLKKKILLESGETVYLHITRIYGTFWKTYKTDPGISKNSNEIDIDGMPEIGVCYMPFEILSYKRPK